MGTSSSQPSPNHPRWLPAIAVLGNPDWPVERQSTEIWRAAFDDRDGRLESELSDPIIATAGLIAGSGIAPFQAMQEFDAAASERNSIGLTVDMARRAMARACADGTGSSGFASELFAEAVSYYASRDLAGIVGASGRVQRTSDSLSLKEGLREVARQAARIGSANPADIDSWSTYVSATLDSLRSSGIR